MRRIRLAVVLALSLALVPPVDTLAQQSANIAQIGSLRLESSPALSSVSLMRTLIK